jgi:hypothetical protein
VTESRSSRFDIGWKFGLIEWFFRWRSILLRNDVVDGLFHLLLFFIYSSKIQLIRSKHIKTKYHTFLPGFITIINVGIN